MLTFATNSRDPNDAYHYKLKEFLNEKEKAITKINKQLNEYRNVEILRDCSMNFMRNLESNSYAGESELLNKDLARLKDDYNQKSKGANKGEILSEFLTGIYPIMMSSQKSGGMNEEEAEYKKNEYETVIKTLQEKVKSLEKQNQSISNANMPPPPRGKDPKDPKGKDSKGKDSKGKDKNK